MHGNFYTNGALTLAQKRGAEGIRGIRVFLQNLYTLSTQRYVLYIRIFLFRVKGAYSAYSFVITPLLTKSYSITNAYSSRILPPCFAYSRTNSTHGGQQ